MKIFKTLLLSVILLCMFNEVSLAQEKKREFSATAGYAVRVFDTDFEGNASGFYLGLNLYKRNATGLTTDAQVSLNYISQDQSSSNILSINALYGIRYYFNSPEASTRVFFNTLVGPAYKNVSGDDSIENVIDFGYSAGIFVAPKKWVFGISIDNPTNLVFKVGLRF